MPTFKRADQEEMEKAKELLETAAPQEAGFAKSLFFGQLRLDRILPYPKQDPTEKIRTDEMIAKVDAFLKQNVDPDQIDAQEEIPKSVIEGLGKLGVMGLTVPREFGGAGFSHSNYCRVLEHISGWCASTAVLIGAHQSIGLKALMLMGTDAQKKEFLPSLAAGERLAAFCLSEPETGSDAANVQTRAQLSEDGQHYILNGGKKFATNAAIAGMMTVMARTTIEDKGKTKEKITAFLVTPDLRGFEIVSPNRSKMGIRGSWQATLRFNNMMVPKDRILGELGKGLRVALSVLDYGRCTLSAGCVGGAKRAMALAIQRARHRHQFSRSISEFHLIKQKIANMAQTTFAMESLTYLAAGLVDEHKSDVMLETAIAKLFCSEGLWQIVDDSLQIWGGEGYMRENGLERMMRDARINRIVEGATEVMTAFVALVGMKGVGDELESVLRAAKHPVNNFGRLAKFARTQWSDIIVGHEFEGLHPELAKEGHALAGQAKTLAKCVLRLLKKYREGILDMQLLQQRIAWAVIDMYASAAVLSRLQSMIEQKGEVNGDEKLNRDLLVGKAFCHQAATRISQRLGTLFKNQDKEIIAVADAVLADPN